MNAFFSAVATVNLKSELYCLFSTSYIKLPILYHLQEMCHCGVTLITVCPVYVQSFITMIWGDSIERISHF